MDRLHVYYTCPGSSFRVAAAKAVEPIGVEIAQILVFKPGTQHRCNTFVLVVGHKLHAVALANLQEQCAASIVHSQQMCN